MATNIDIQGTPISRLPRESSPAGVDVSGVKSGRTVKVSLDLLATKDDVNNIDNNRKGYFPTDTELKAAYPKPKTGWYAYVGSTGTIWKESGGAWVDTGQPIPDDVDLSLYVKKVDLTELKQNINHIFLPDRSFSGRANIDYGYLCNFSADSEFTGYKDSGVYDSAWVQIFNDSGNLEILNVSITRVVFFKDFLPTLENYLGNSLLSKPTIIQGTKLALITLKKIDNPNGYLDMVVNQEGAGVKIVDFVSFRNVSAKKSIEVDSAFFTYPRGKNWLNPDDVLLGYSLSDGQFIEFANGIFSNRLFLLTGKKYTIQGVKAFSTLENSYIAYFDKKNDYLGRSSYPIEDGNSTFSYSPIANTHYSRLLLRANGEYNPSIAQLTESEVFSEFETYQGTEYLLEEKNVLKNILLTGASFAYPGNQWFNILCDKLDVVGYNKAVSGETMQHTANKMYEGNLYSNEEFEAFGIFLIFHSHNQVVDSTVNLKENYTDYTYPFTTDKSICWDYVIKKYEADCYAAKDNPKSKWYGTKYGKPCIIVVCTHWHDARVIFNTGIRNLRNKWGFHLIELDKEIGFSMNQVHAITGNQTSILHAVDNETIDNVIYGWHPIRTNGAYIQQNIAIIIAHQLGKII